MSDIALVHTFVQRVADNVSHVILGKAQAIEQTMLALLCEGHLLIEDVPGLGKTMLARSMARSIGCTFNRIQFTPDMLPSDVTGISVYNQKSQEFEFRPGPIFAQIVLADEINRATPKTQAALLEAMEERQVTIDGKTYDMQRPFLVLATQNPIEQEGTYPLPEAQVDRFMLKLRIGYPTREEERQILETMARTSGLPEARRVVNTKDVLEAREVVNEIYVDEKVKDYIVDLVCCTRDPGHYNIQVQDFIQMGASPRATIALTLCAKAYAFLRGRGYVTPQDVKTIGMDVLRHRVAVTYEAEAEDKTPETIVQRIFDELPVP